MIIVVGLGNPGPEYTWTRHNAGFFVVDRLAARWDLKFRRERHADVAVAPGRGVTLVKPRSYMNLSGGPVQAVMTRTRARLEDLLVVHDDLDLPLGRLRFKEGGGAGGQRGVKDIAARLGPDFTRLKVGISRPPAGWEAERWVLARFTEDERELLDTVIDAAALAVETLLAEGLAAAMGATNGLDLAARAGSAEVP
ncbi:MAG TPA: aminoacyl-tRNA hydrolase [Trueperaceae bacterium]|nr:aminoacyl-tRNA hydrolase [Trueperaceae bacterium]